MKLPKQTILGLTKKASLLSPQKVEQKINSSKGAGQPLPANTQADLGVKMNTDLSNVKVHTDSNSVQMNKEIGAKAFTHGNDVYFNQVSNLLKETPQAYFKHLSGEFYTANGFGLWMALNILREQTVPTCVKMNSIDKEKYQMVLLYNQYRGKDHSLTLLKKC